MMILKTNCFQISASIVTRPSLGKEKTQHFLAMVKIVDSTVSMIGPFIGRTAFSSIKVNFTKLLHSDYDQSLTDSPIDF